MKNGRTPGIYTDWPAAQEQITGWTKPRHKCFSTRAEAQKFLDADEQKTLEASEATDADPETSVIYSTSEGQNAIIKKPPPTKKAKRGINSSAKGAKLAVVEYNEAYYEAGTGPLPPGAEDGFDPNIMLEAETGTVIYKTQEQRQATKSLPTGGSQTGILRIYTDGSSLGNGKAEAFAGVGVYFGPGDQR